MKTGGLGFSEVIEEALELQCPDCSDCGCSWLFPAWRGGIFLVLQFEWPETASCERRSCKDFLRINMESCVLEMC